MSRPEIAIDIGGGEGEFFLRLAKENPQKTFIVLDPCARKIEGGPPNLHFVRWKTDLESHLPFSVNQLDEAHISFMFGEIGFRDIPDLEELGNTTGHYRNLLRDLKGVLKPGGLISIVDVRGNIFYIQRLLEEEGHQVIQEPRPIRDKERSWWTKTFAGSSEILKLLGIREEESYFLPMEIKARWNGEAPSSSPNTSPTASM